MIANAVHLLLPSSRFIVDKAATQGLYNNINTRKLNAEAVVKLTLIAAKTVLEAALAEKP